MIFTEFIGFFRDFSHHDVEFALPNGSKVSRHCRITEVGRGDRSFLDCGGVRPIAESCVLPMWLADDTDDRLVAAKLGSNFGITDGLLPTDGLLSSGDLPGETEHEAAVLTRVSICGGEVTAEALRCHMEWKHTDCLAKDLGVLDLALPAMACRSTCRSRCALATGCRKQPSVENPA